MKPTLEKTINDLAEISLMIDDRFVNYRKLYDTLLIGVSIIYDRKQSEVFPMFYKKRKLLEKFKNGNN